MCLSIADPITRDFFLLKYSGKSVPPPKKLTLKGVFEIIIKKYVCYRDIH